MLDDRDVRGHGVGLRSVGESGTCTHDMSADMRALATAAPRPILIVLHQEQSNPGQVGQRLSARGLPLDIRRPRFGDPLPTTLARHAGVVIFGGPMSANDRDDYIGREIALAALAMREERPLLGICLGAQMMAIALGAKVAPHPQAHVEIGYHAIEPTGHADIGGPWPDRVYQWHREGFELAAGTVPLALADGAFANQAFRYGRAAVGVQFHPEITYAMVARWSTRNEHRLDVPGARPRQSQLADHVAHGPRVQRWLDAFLDQWLELDQLR